MELIATFLLVFARLVAVTMTAPLLGSKVVGRLARFAIAFGLALLAIPLVQPTTIALDSADFGSAVLSEFLVGGLLGLGVAILFSAAQMGGTVIGQMAGMQMADQIDPNSGGSSTAVGQLFAIVSLAVFAIIGGPELVLTACLDTFAQLPLGTSLETPEVLGLITQLLQQSFVLTLKGVGPAIASLLIATLVIGMVGRAYPQINMLHVGLNSNLVIMLLTIFLTLGGSIWLFVDDWQQSIEVIQAAIVPVTS